MSARPSEDGLGRMLPDPTVLERMLSAAGLRVNGNGGGATSIAATGTPNLQAQHPSQQHATTSFAAALESIVREELEAAAAAEAAAADTALRRASGPAAAARPLSSSRSAPQPQPQPPPPRKRCRLCKAEQPLENFYRVSTAKDGRDARCRTCDARKCAERRKRRRERQEPAADQGGNGNGEPAAPPPAEKLCKKCTLLKPAGSFYRNRASNDGLCDLCKPCFNAAAGARKDAKVRQRREEAAAAALAFSTAAAATTTTVLEKHCRRCALRLPARDFHRDAATADGLARSCKRCHGDQKRERAERTGRSEGDPDSGAPPQLPPLPPRPPHSPPEEKDCGRCGARRARGEFHASSAAADGL